MPTVLHESTGLRIVRNDINHFVVINLHYTADPSKRSEEWKQEASRGLSPARWAKEMEMDDTAMMGERVFPEIFSKADKIIIPPKDFPSSQVYWAGFDYGIRHQNPCSFHVYTIGDDGAMYSVWELFEPCSSLPELANKLKACPYWHKIKYIASDPHIGARTSHNKEGVPCSVLTLLEEQGITKLYLSDNNEQIWLSMMRRHWQAEDPTFKIFTTCPNQIREFETSIFATQSERQLQTQNYREVMVDKNNHSLDDCKYYMLSRPKIQKSTFKFPLMVKKWLK